MQIKKKRCSRLGIQCSIALFIICNFYSSVAVTGDANGVCISPGGCFPQFRSEGLPPRKASKGPNDLTACRIFRKRTCCTSAQTHPILISIRKLASVGEASEECLALWELLECSICDPYVGVRPGPPVICRSFCDSILQACSNAYFAVDPKTQVLAPCGSRDTLCGKGLEWTSNGTEFCQLAGFSVLEPMERSIGIENTFCFDGRTSIEKVNAWETTSQSKSSEKVWDSTLRQEFHRWVMQMDTSERISWAVGGLVLTAGVIYMSKRRSRSYRLKQAALHRTKNMLEVRAKQQSTMNSYTTKSNKGQKRS
uniref:Folate receptor-like domain-containing protein n=1 Tax=Araucaria cunninghamii TaxID=56994 RepID=A0A0D6R5Y6_ARACU